jgi:DNA-binding SARP family transcriptional activator
MDLRILGPLEVSEGSRPVEIPRGRQRALLACLALRANEPVSVDRLVEDLWGDGAPPTAPKIVQNYVSQLRRALGEQVILTRAQGYELRIEPEQLDAARFESLLEQARRDREEGDSARAAGLLRDAIDLWRGPPLADFSFESFAQSEIARLEELRLLAIEERIDAELTLGRHAELIGDLERLVLEHPVRERLRGLLMLALYRSGRQAEALEAYRDARRVLVEELGLEPAAELQRLEQAILQHDPALGAPSFRAQQPRRRSAGLLVGRERELGTLGAALDDALAGRGGLVLLAGDPGIGKTRLADELASQAMQRGARVLLGRCWEAGGAPAYWPWVQALRSYVRDVDSELLRGQIGPRGGELARLLPELRDLVPDLPPELTLDPETARFQLFDAVAAFLRTAGEAQPLVLVLDDLHVADLPSLLLLQFVAAELADASVLAVGAYRPDEPGVHPAHAEALADLARLSSTSLLVPGLDVSDVGIFVEAVAGLAPPPSLVEAVHRKTDGNPLFVGELVRMLAAEGRFQAVEDPQWRFAVPRGIRDVIGRRVSRLASECQRVLALASVLGREFSLDVLGRFSGLAPAALLELLDEALAARLITDVPGVLGRLRFSHALVRDTLYDGLAPSQRVELHRAAGRILEAIHAADPEPHLADLARHFVEAAPAGEASKAVDCCRRAAEYASDVLAYEEAERLYRLALQALAYADGPTEAIRCDLLLGLGDALARSGDGPGAKETFLSAADLARGIGAPERLARAALGYGGRFVWARAGTDKHLVPLLESALTGLGGADSPLRVRVLARLAGALRDQHEREPRAVLSQEAVEMARRLADPATLAYALDSRCTAVFGPENTEERIALATELIGLAEQVGDRERAAAARYLRMMFLLELGDIAAVKAGLEAVAELTEELRQPAQLWLLVVTRATLALFEGRFEEGEELIEEALAVGQRAQGSDAVLSHRIQRFTLGLLQGDLEGLETILRLSVDDYPARPMFRCMLARLYADLGRESDARTVVEELTADRFAALPLTNEWLFSMGFLSEVVRWLGDAGRAQTIYELLLPYASRNACTADYISTGSVSRSLALAAATLRRFSEAARHFEAALELNERMGARPWAAYTRYDYARTLLEAGEPERAEALLRETLGAAQELGMARLAADVAAALNRAPAARS